MTTEPKDADVPAGTSRAATVVTWAIVVLVGEATLVLLVLVLGSFVRVDNPIAYVAAFGAATLVGGRAGGIRGWARWMLAGILIVLVAISLALALVWMAVSQIRGP